MQPKYLFYQINVKKLQKGQSKEKGIKKVFIISNVEPWNAFLTFPSLNTDNLKLFQNSFNLGGTF